MLPKLAANPKAKVDDVLPEKVDDPAALVEEVLREEWKAVEDYKAGKKQALNYLIGAAMRRARKRAIDPRRVRELLLERLREV